MAIFVNDTLTDGDNVLLTAHTGETGATWAAASYDAGIWRFDASSRVYPQDAGVVLASGTPGSADYEVESTFRRYTNDSGTAAICGRFIGASGNGYLGGYLYSSSEWVLWRMDGGTRTLIGTGSADTLTAGNDYVLTLRVEGTTISLYVNGTERVSTTDATYSAAGSVGLYASSLFGPGTRWAVDDFSAATIVPPSAAPVVSAGADATIVAGDTFTRTVTFTDADSASWTAEVDYGEGAGPVAATVDDGAKTVALSNLYEATGVYTVTVEVDDGTTTGQDSFVLTVDPVPNVAPSVDAGSNTSLATGGTLTRTATFTDADSAGPWTATVDYGEGAGPQAVTPGSGTVPLSNVYEADGVYTVTVTVTDEDSAVGSDSFTVTVGEIGVIIPNNAYRVAILHAGGWI